MENWNTKSEDLLTKVSQHRSDARHVLNDVVRDVTNPLGQGVKIDWFDDLERFNIK